MAKYISLDNLTLYDSNIKDYIASAIGAVEKLTYEVVQTLPTQDISTTTIYLVPKSTAGTSNVYDEYLYISNNWELIGDTEVDLSNYYTKTEADNLLSAKANVTDIPDDTSDLTNGAGYITGLTYVDYGDTSVSFADVKAMRDAGKIVYCRTSNGRYAFLAYSSAQKLEFQYFRSVATKSMSNQTDEMYVYSLTSGGWSTETRTINYKLAAGTNIALSYASSSNVLTINGPTNYLATDNTTAYTPSGDYQPATKLYVDSNVVQKITTSLNFNTEIGTGIYEVTDDNLDMTYYTDLTTTPITTVSIPLEKGDFITVLKSGAASTYTVGDTLIINGTSRNISLEVDTIIATAVTYNDTMYKIPTEQELENLNAAANKIGAINIINSDGIDFSSLNQGYYYLPANKTMARMYYKLLASSGNYTTQYKDIPGPIYFSVYNDWSNDDATLCIYYSDGMMEKYEFDSISQNRNYWRYIKYIEMDDLPTTYGTYSSATFLASDIENDITWISVDTTTDAYINGASTTTSFTIPKNSVIYGCLNKMVLGTETYATLHPYMVLPTGEIYNIKGATISAITIEQRSSGGGSSGPAIYKVDLKAATLDTTVLKNIGDAWHDNEEHIVIGYYDDATYSVHGSSMAEEYYDTTTSTMYLTFGPIMSIASAKYGITYRDYFNFVVSFQYFTDTGNVSNAVKSNSTSKSIRYNATGDTENFPLGVNNSSSYTPTNDYNPATKKYVDDAVAGGGGGGTTYTAGDYINIDSNNVISGNIVLTRSTASSSDVGTSSTKRLDLDTLKPGKYIYENYSSSSAFYYKYTQGGASSQTNTSFSISTGDSYSVFTSYMYAYRIEIEVYKATSELASAATGTPMMHIRFVPANANNAEGSFSSYATTVEYELYRNSSKGLSNNRIYSSVNIPNLSSKLYTINSTASTANSNANQALQATTSLDARVTALEQGGGGTEAHSYKCIAYGNTSSGSSASLYGSSYYQPYSSLTVNATLSLSTGTSDITGGYFSIGDSQGHFSETYSKVIVQFIDPGMYRVVGEMVFENVQFNGSGVTSTSVTSGLYTGSYFLQVFAVYDEEVQYGLYQSTSYSSSASVYFTDYMYGVATGSSVGLSCYIDNSMGNVSLGFSGGMQPSGITYPFIKKARLHVYYYDSSIAQSFDDYYDLGDFNDQYGISLSNTYIRFNSSGDTSIELLYDNSNGAGGEKTMNLSSLITDTGSTYSVAGGYIPVYAWNSVTSFTDTIKNVGFTSIINDIGDLVISTNSMSLSVSGSAPNMVSDGSSYYLLISKGIILKTYYMSSSLNGAYDYVIMDFEKHVGDNYPSPQSYEYMRVYWEYYMSAWSGRYCYSYSSMTVA